MSRIAEEASAAATAAQTTTNESSSKSLLDLQMEDLRLQNVSKLIGDYMVDSDLENCTQAIPSFLIACREDVAERKCVHEELLPHVFSANSKGIEEFFTAPSVFRQPKILLTKASYREGYQSRKLNDFVCFRQWEGVSPLQAAYLCGDGPFIGRRLLTYIIDNTSRENIDRLLADARQQLQELLNRVRKVQVEEVASVAGAAAAVAPVEKEFADSAEFLSPIKALSNAYQACVSHYDSLASRNQYTELDRLWGEVGECHRRLPRYILQEFFGPIPFDPVPEFNIEPPRGACRYWNDSLLDLDGLGSSTFIGIYKGPADSPALGPAPRAARVFDVCVLDLAAINRLCELREVDLRNTISCLQSLETALTLINRNQTVRVVR